MRRQKNEYSVNCLVLIFVNCRCAKNKVPSQIGCRIALSEFMYGYLLMIIQAVGYTLINICFIASFRNFSTLISDVLLRVLSQPVTILSLIKKLFVI